jgi:hypothetical protein
MYNLMKNTFFSEITNKTIYYNKKLLNISAIKNRIYSFSYFPFIRTLHSKNNLKLKYSSFYFLKGFQWIIRLFLDKKKKKIFNRFKLLSLRVKVLYSQFLFKRLIIINKYLKHVKVTSYKKIIVNTLKKIVLFLKKIFKTIIINKQIFTLVFQLRAPFLSYTGFNSSLLTYKSYFYYLFFSCFSSKKLALRKIIFQFQQLFNYKKLPYSVSFPVFTLTFFDFTKHESLFFKFLYLLKKRLKIKHFILETSNSISLTLQTLKNKPGLAIKLYKFINILCNYFTKI